MKEWKLSKTVIGRQFYGKNPRTMASILNTMAHERLRGGLNEEDYRKIGIGPDLSTWEDVSQLQEVQIIDGVKD